MRCTWTAGSRSTCSIWSAATRHPEAAGLRRPGPADRVRRLAPGRDLSDPGRQGPRVPPGPGLCDSGGHQGSRVWTSCATGSLLTYRADAEGTGARRTPGEGSSSAFPCHEPGRGHARGPADRDHHPPPGSRHRAGEYSSAFRGRGRRVLRGARVPTGRRRRAPSTGTSLPAWARPTSSDTSRSASSPSLLPW